jgi:hypothetical protein
MKIEKRAHFRACRVLFVFAVLGLLAAGCSPSNMVLKPTKLDVKTVKPAPGKAALVVARTTSMGFAINFFTYIDHDFIGVTRGKSCFVKNDIDPGTKYLIARTESLETGKINFEPDTVYYVQQTPRMGWVVARVTLTPVDREHLISELDDGLCEEYEINAKDVAEKLSEHEYQEAVTDYEREVKEGFHKEFADYKGLRIERVASEAGSVVKEAPGEKQATEGLNQAAAKEPKSAPTGSN